MELGGPKNLKDRRKKENVNKELFIPVQQKQQQIHLSGRKNIYL